MASTQTETNCIFEAFSNLFNSFILFRLQDTCICAVISIQIKLIWLQSILSVLNAQYSIQMNNQQFFANSAIAIAIHQSCSPSNSTHTHSSVWTIRLATNSSLKWLYIFHQDTYHDASLFGGIHRFRMFSVNVRRLHRCTTKAWEFFRFCV